MGCVWRVFISANLRSRVRRPSAITFADPCVKCSPPEAPGSTYGRHFIREGSVHFAVVQRPPEGLIRTEPTVYTDGSARIDRSPARCESNRESDPGRRCVCVFVVCVYGMCVMQECGSGLSSIRRLVSRLVVTLVVSPINGYNELTD